MLKEYRICQTIEKSNEKAKSEEGKQKETFKHF